MTEIIDLVRYLLIFQHYEIIKKILAKAYTSRFKNNYSSKMNLYNYYFFLLGVNNCFPEVSLSWDIDYKES